MNGEIITTQRDPKGRTNPFRVRGVQRASTGVLMALLVLGPPTAYAESSPGGPGANGGEPARVGKPVTGAEPSSPRVWPWSTDDSCGACQGTLAGRRPGGATG